MSWHDDLRRFEGSMQGVLRQDFEFVELQRREDNFLHRSLVLKFGNDLPIISLPQTELICWIAKPDRNSSLLINSATGENSQCRKIIGFIDAEL